MVIPYAHKMGHNMRSAKRFDIAVDFSAPNKKVNLCVEVNKCLNEQPQCNKRHRNGFIPCQGGVVYVSSHSCGVV